MPILGLFAIFRSACHLSSVLWRKETFRSLLWVTAITIFSGTWFYHQFEPTITTWVDAYYFRLFAN